MPNFLYNLYLHYWIMKQCAMTYLRKDRKTLMIHKNKRPDKYFYGYWDAPGGKIEPGETPKQAAVREMEEESGLKIRNPRLRSVMIFRNLFGKDWKVHVFTAEDYEGELEPENREGSLSWIDDSQLFKLNLCDADHVFMPLLKKHDYFEAEFMHDGDVKMLDYKVDIH
ncbi:NUDIX domain-containing protein [Candidatus Woesearchaeota archaeon]|nr:NUDIX domain-containing protein [Candidatus Woesearchaeota archaeon]